LSFIHCAVFRDAAGAGHRGGTLALAHGKMGSCASAAELVTLGIVLGTKHSDLRGCCSARHRPGGARVVGVRALTLASRVAGEVQCEPRRARSWTAKRREHSQEKALAFRALFWCA